MILVLIFIGVFVLNVILTIIAHITDWDEEMFAIPVGVGFFALLGCIVTGIWCIVVNTPHYAKTEEYAIQEKIKLYQNEKDILESFHLVTDDSGKTTFTSDITIEQISTVQYYERVEKYNKKIYDFKVSVYGHTYRRHDPWLNWFESAAWDTVNPEIVENLGYTTGK